MFAEAARCGGPSNKNQTISHKNFTRLGHLPRKVPLVRSFLDGSQMLYRSYNICRDLYQYAVLALVRRLRVFFRLIPGESRSSLPHSLPSEDCSAITSSSLISIVIPSFNEGDSIKLCIDKALAADNVEVILADGGSTDGTCTAAEASGATVLRNCTKGRAGCMNDGARAAKGDLFVFLHGDTHLPHDWADCVRSALAERKVAIAAFKLSLSPRLRFLWLVEVGANWRARHRQLPYGDQVLCMRREVYEALNGFPSQPLLEDVDIVCAARRCGEVRLLDAYVVSSSRRWVKYGVVGNWYADAVRNRRDHIFGARCTSYLSVEL